MYPSKLVLELREIGEMTILQFVEWKSVCEHFSYFFLTMSCIFQLVFGLKFLAVFTQFGTKFRCFHSQLVPVSKSETGKFFLRSCCAQFRTCWRKKNHGYTRFKLWFSILVLYWNTSDNIFTTSCNISAFNNGSIMLSSCFHQ